jgi:ubiquinone/menaquinone biosynthesis C-methylase UbiE
VFKQIGWADSSFINNQSHMICAQELVDIAAKQTRLSLIPKPNDYPSFNVRYATGCEHWSRIFEWPWAAAAAALSHRDVVLEAGGGHTEFQFLLARYVKHVVNYDVSQASLDDSELMAKQLGAANVLCRRGDLTSICYPDNHFDKVFCISVVEHIVDYAEKAVDELWRVLKPGGRLLLTMDITKKARPDCPFDIARAQRTLDRWELQVPPMPTNALHYTVKLFDGSPDTLSVLCVAVEKP